MEVLESFKVMIMLINAFRCYKYAVHMQKHSAGRSTIGVEHDEKLVLVTHAQFFFTSLPIARLFIVEW
jgi:hypothetical protein